MILQTVTAKETSGKHTSVVGYDSAPSNLNHYPTLMLTLM